MIASNTGTKKTQAINISVVWATIIEEARS